MDLELLHLAPATNGRAPRELLRYGCETRNPVPCLQKEHHRDLPSVPMS
jgi:hypothetical protein